eukprot:TRINITY_DN30675_c0_g1_i1.p1 TRINITY_DN30675_c0_g1~~TRINITY_DN30675_c0_g1_i1.p1  ORF type:complete len:514 (+),score=104.42 TRINITY_DN30675_c0_g1_i1:3-1544(+)
MDEHQNEGLRADDGKDAIRRLSIELSETKRKCSQQISETLELVSRLQEKAAVEKSLRQALSDEEGLAEERLRDLREYQSLCVKKEQSLANANQQMDDLRHQLAESQEKLQQSVADKNNLQTIIHTLQNHYGETTARMLSQISAMREAIQLDPTSHSSNHSFAKLFSAAISKFQSLIQFYQQQASDISAHIGSNPNAAPSDQDLEFKNFLDRQKSDFAIMQSQEQGKEAIRRLSEDHIDIINRMKTDHEKEIQKVTKTVNLLKSDLTNLQDHCTSLRSAAEARDAKRLSSIKELQTINSNLKQKIESRSPPRSEKVSDLLDIISNYELKVGKLEDKIHELSNKSHKLEASKKSVISRYNSLVDEASKLSSQMSVVKTEYQTETDKSSQLQAANLSLVKDCENQSAQVISMKKELQAYRNSMSEKELEIEHERLLSSKVNEDAKKLIEDVHNLSQQLAESQQAERQAISATQRMEEETTKYKAVIAQFEEWAEGIVRSSEEKVVFSRPFSTPQPV